jgi:nitrogen regulatory protein PII 2
MKEIVAIIRPKKMGATKDALDALGFPSLTAVPVIGRGKQRGIASEVNYDFTPALLSQGKSGGMKYVPKRMLSLVVADEDVDSVLQTIIRVNQTSQIGDGKIFVCPIDDVLRVRTSETGNAAVR